MFWLKTPISFWSVVFSYFFRRILRLPVPVILGNWVYLLRLTLPLNYQIFRKGDRVTVMTPHQRPRVSLRFKSSDVLVYIQVFFKGEYHLLNDLLLPSKPCIIDLGANVGLFSLLCQSRWPEARIVAVEPDPENFQQLTFQFQQNNLPLADAICAGVWTHNKNLSITQTNDLLAWSFQVKEDPTGNIHGISIRSLLESKNLHRIDLLKMDIEGTEVLLFKDSDFLAVLQKQIGVIILETHHPLEQKEIAETLSVTGFDVFWDRELLMAKNKGMSS